MKKTIASLVSAVIAASAVFGGACSSDKPALAYRGYWNTHGDKAIFHTGETEEHARIAAEESGWKGIISISSKIYRTNLCGEQHKAHRIVGINPEGEESTVLVCCGSENRCSLRNPDKADYAVVLIDMQDYFLQDINKEELKREMPYQIEALRFAQRNNIPVYVLEYEGDGATTQSLMQALSGSGYEIITKSDNDGFHSTPLDLILKQRNISTLVLMGVNASACVWSTAKGALGNNYKIMTSPEIIADSTYLQSHHESAEWYKENGLWFETHTELIKYLDARILENSF